MKNNESNCGRDDEMMKKCPGCNGYGRAWDGMGYTNDDCSICNGEGEIEQTLGEEIIDGLEEFENDMG